MSQHAPGARCEKDFGGSWLGRIAVSTLHGNLLVVGASCIRRETCTPQHIKYCFGLHLQDVSYGVRPLPNMGWDKRRATGLIALDNRGAQSVQEKNIWPSGSTGLTATIAADGPPKRPYGIEIHDDRHTVQR